MSKELFDYNYKQGVKARKFQEKEEILYRQVFENKLCHLSWADVPLDRIKQIRELIEPYLNGKNQEK